MPQCDFNKVAELHIFRTPLLKNTSGGLLLIYIDHDDDSFDFTSLIYASLIFSNFRSIRQKIFVIV